MNNKRLLFALAAFIALALFTPVASAGTLGTLYLSGYPVNQADGVYVDWVPFTFTNGSQTQTESLLCYSFNLESYLFSNWNVDETTLTNDTYSELSTDLTGSMYYPDVAAYAKAAVLTTALDQDPSDGAAIQFAIWAQFYAGTPTYGDSAGWTSWVNGVNLADYTYSGSVFSPVGESNTNQEYGDLTAKQVVPEPPTGALFAGLTLLGFAYVGKRKFTYQ